MASRGTRANRGRWNARTIRTAIGAEVRLARTLAGLSQRVAGAAADMSHAQFGRIERGELSDLTVEQLSRACAAVGLRLAVRAYQDGDPVADAAHLALLARMRVQLPGSAAWRTEVPLQIEGDRRAWDAVALLSDGSVAFEAETRLLDVQALERRLVLKQRDGRIDRVVLLLADTRANRRALAAHRDALRGTFPLDARDVMASLRAGLMPAANGIVVI